ncbi:MAG: CaiB/BaiF CoA transferase family protein, partial [Alphaproteobacteria bacterium]
MQAALEDLLVLDFSTLLPGPLASLIMAEAGARVIKIERPGIGDEMRTYMPEFGEAGVNFAMLNRGKESLVIDLKDPAARSVLEPLIVGADILIEQFRPGVMKRLGLDYDTVREINAGIVYCSITGYGQTGPLADKAGHDLNYMAETGCLGTSADPEGNPILPSVLAGDIAGGSYPALINVLMALLRRQRTGEGCYIDIAMTDSLFTFLYWALGEGFSTGRWPSSGQGLITGRSPRYAIYRTSDHRHVSVAALEERFWVRFCDIVGLEPEYRDDARDAEATKRRLAEIFAGGTAAEWQAAFDGKDVCCAIVASVEEATKNPQFQSRGLFDREVTSDGCKMPALPVPLAESIRSPETDRESPRLGAYR